LPEQFGHKDNTDHNLGEGRELKAVSLGTKPKPT
jgi:hypothetical protein